MKVEVYKCYLVEVVDDDGNVVDSQYIFTDRKDAIRQGKEMKADVLRKKATPREQKSVSSGMMALAKSMAASGYTNADIAERLGVSATTVSKILNGKQE